MFTEYARTHAQDQVLVPRLHDLQHQRSAKDERNMYSADSIATYCFWSANVVFLYKAQGLSEDLLMMSKGVGLNGCGMPIKGRIELHCGMFPEVQSPKNVYIYDSVTFMLHACAAGATSYRYIVVSILVL